MERRRFLGAIGAGLGLTGLGAAGSFGRRAMPTGAQSITLEAAPASAKHAGRATTAWALNDSLPAAQVYGYKFELGPGSKGKIETRFFGRDPDILRDLERQTLDIFHSEPLAKSITTNWRQRVKVVEPIIADEEANIAGITRPDIAMALAGAFECAQTRYGAQPYAPWMYCQSPNWKLRAMATTP